MLARHGRTAAFRILCHETPMHTALRVFARDNSLERSSY